MEVFSKICCRIKISPKTLIFWQNVCKIPDVIPEVSCNSCRKWRNDTYPMFGPAFLESPCMRPVHYQTGRILTNQIHLKHIWAGKKSESCHITLSQVQNVISIQWLLKKVIWGHQSFGWQLSIVWGRKTWRNSMISSRDASTHLQRYTPVVARDINARSNVNLNLQGHDTSGKKRVYQDLLSVFLFFFLPNILTRARVAVSTKITLL